MMNVVASQMNYFYLIFCKRIKESEEKAFLPPHKNSQVAFL